MPNARVSTFIIEALLKPKSYIKPYTLIVADFYTSLSQIGSSSKQKLNRKIMGITEVTNQMDLTADIYRTFYTKKYTFFSAP